MSIFGPVQFSAGDQGERKWIFAESYMKKCPACTGTSIQMDHFPEGCRMNGDAYGTDVFICTTCQWKTSFQYDDSSDPYYYEKPMKQKQSKPDASDSK